MLASTAKSVKVSLDYLTLTYADQQTRMLVEDAVKGQIHAREREGEDIRSWQGLGYTGLGAGGISWGTREDTDIVRASGMWAEHMFDVLRSYRGNCTRIDLQVTVELETPKRGVASTWYSRLILRGTSSPARSTSLIVNSRGGETLYIGSRKSDKFGRLYDKGAEARTADPGQIYRYEVEFKGDAAPIIYRSLTASKARPILVAATVERFFEERGVKVPWRSATDPIEVLVSKHPTSVDSSLSWLRNQVRGTVQRLKARGLEASIIEALGLEG